MKPELERRAAAAFAGAALVMPDERDQIVQGLQQADTFDELSPQTQELIIELEQRTHDQQYQVVGGVVVTV